jgi:hypothetical protein
MTVIVDTERLDTFMEQAELLEISISRQLAEAILEEVEQG